MKNFAFISIVIISLLACSCEKDNQLSGNDYFIFGTAHGECIGNCAIFYKITEDKLYIDDMDYLAEFVFLPEPLSYEKYLLTIGLVEDMPEYLSENPDETFGCPDCADQGGIHIEYRKNGVTHFWHIDTDVSQQPIEIREYVVELLSVMESLQ
jgi:hypothetical protein